MEPWPFADFGNCDWCGQVITGSHYHCGTCDSKDVTSMYGHHIAVHFENGKRVKVDFHHCSKESCELEDA